VVPTGGGYHDLTNSPGSEARKVLGPAQAAMALANCPSGGMVPPIEDQPHGSPPRILIARITLRSGCDASSVTKYWIQVIGPNGATVRESNADPLEAIRALLRAFGLLR
jgi:hypothetical protein